MVKQHEFTLDKRGNRALYVGILVLIIYTVCCGYFARDYFMHDVFRNEKPSSEYPLYMLYMMCIICVGLISLFLSELIFRCMLFGEEMQLFGPENVFLLQSG